MSLRSIRALGSFLLLAFLIASPAGAGDAKASGPLVVKIHADWCGTCVKLNSTWDELQARYGESATFVVLDVTDREATQAAAAEAERLGITAFFDAHKGKTGTVGILDAKTGEAVSVMKGEFDAKAYDAPLAGALKTS